MKLAVEFEVLWGECQDVGIFGSFGNAAKALVKIVVVVNKNSAGAVGKDGEKVVVGGSRRGLDKSLSRWRRMCAGRSDVSEWQRGIESTSIETIDDDLRAERAINDVRIVILHLGRNKTGRNEDDASLAGHAGDVAFHLLQNTE